MFNYFPNVGIYCLKMFCIGGLPVSHVGGQKQ